MASKEFPLIPEQITPVSTKYRKLSGLLPHPKDVQQIEKLRKLEARSMRGQAPAIWDRAEGINIFDKHGNQWLDFSSGVLITNAGHGHKRMVEAIVSQARKPLLTTYCFAHQARIDLVEELLTLAPAELNKVFLLSTGSEATECALKLMRTRGRTINENKNIIVSFTGSFHGRTMGAQLMGGIAGGKAWIKNHDPEIVHVPFPDGFRNEDTRFGLFEETLAQLPIQSEDVAGVISETYQGIGPYFMPQAYARDLREWCDKYDVLLCFDEVQAGFGRCGTMWGFEYYGVIPDLICVGKGISSSLPISGVIGRTDIMDHYGPNEMTSTHSGNPLSCAAALANLRIIKEEKLVENAARVGRILEAGLATLKEQFPEVIGYAPAKGLVGGLLICKPNSKDPNSELAWQIINNCFRSGLMLFAPVGMYGECVKIAPPLSITDEALKEGLDVLRQAIIEALAS